MRPKNGGEPAPAVETVPSEPQMCWYQISKGANWGRYQLAFLFKRQNPSIACVVGTYRGLLAEFGTFLALLMLMLVPIQTLPYLCCLLIGLVWSRNRLLLVRKFVTHHVRTLQLGGGCRLGFRL